MKLRSVPSARVRASACLALVLASGSPCALAAQPGSGTSPGPITPTTSARSGPSSPPVPGRTTLAPEVRPTLEREHAMVTQAQAMTGVATSVWEYQVQGKPDIRTTHTLRFALAKPASVRLETDELLAVSDGITLTVYDKQAKRFVQENAPDVWLLKTRINALTGGRISTIPSEHLLRPGVSIEQAQVGMVTAERLRAGDQTTPAGKKSGVWVVGTGPTANGLPAPRVERWFAGDTGLMLVAVTDLTTRYQEQAKRYHTLSTRDSVTPSDPPVVRLARWTTTYTRELPQSIDASTFRFTPNAGDTKADTLAATTPAPAASAPSATTGTTPSK